MKDIKWKIIIETEKRFNPLTGFPEPERKTVWIKEDGGGYHRTVAIMCWMDQEALAQHIVDLHNASLEGSMIPSEERHV